MTLYICNLIPCNSIAFDEFPLWGSEEFFDGFERPLGQQYCLILMDGERIIFDFVPDEKESAFIERICRYIGADASEASL